MSDNPTQLEAVFYSRPTPSSLSTLTLLGLVFDRVHFPNVHLPTEGFDPEWVASEIQRVEALGFKDYDTWQMLQLMRFCLHPELRDFCFFTGTEGQVFSGDELKGVASLVETIHEQMFGKNPPGFTPMFSTGHNKGLPRERSIDYPGAFYYQANALLYSGRTGIPLLNDDPRMPVPALGGAGAKYETNLLASIMALECVNLVLPDVGELKPAQIVEIRQELKDYVRPFRLKLLGLAKSLNAEIRNDADGEEIRRAAEFLVRTDVYPALEEFKSELSKAGSHSWISRTWELTKSVPALAASYSMWNPVIAVPASIAAFGSWFIAGITEKKPRSGLHYLLRLQDRMSASKGEGRRKP
jgi:hypothetical protein